MNLAFRCCILVFSAIVVSELLFAMFYRNSSVMPLYFGKNKPVKILPSENPLMEGYPIFCLVICDSNADDLKKVTRVSEEANASSRQFNQTVNLLKSAASLTNSTYLNFIVLVDQYWIYDQLLEKISSWPEHIRERLVLQRRGIWYPENRQNLRFLFRVCAMERIFLSDLLPDVDAVVYLDTDAIFMRPPEELWNQFYLFNSHQLAGLVQCFYYYNKYFKFPHYGPTGLNAGLWMMNLTRMRSFPGGWVNECLKILDKYGHHLNYYVQDLSNILFFKHPELMYDVGCHWNYRYRLCSEGTQLCSTAADVGVHLMHGVALTFFNEIDMKWKMFYEAWDAYDPSRPRTELLNLIRTYLAKVKTKTSSSQCSKIKGIDEIFTKGLRNLISGT